MVGVVARIINGVVATIIAGVAVPVTGIGAAFIWIGSFGLGEMCIKSALKNTDDTTQTAQPVK